MDNFERIELIIKGRLAERKRALELCKNVNNLYATAVKHDVDALMRVLGDINALKNNHYSVSDAKLLTEYR